MCKALYYVLWFWQWIRQGLCMDFTFQWERIKLLHVSAICDTHFAKKKKKMKQIVIGMWTIFSRVVVREGLFGHYFRWKTKEHEKLSSFVWFLLVNYQRCPFLCGTQSCLGSDFSVPQVWARFYTVSRHSQWPWWKVHLSQLHMAALTGKRSIRRLQGKHFGQRKTPVVNTLSWE